ncbi:replicative DNA helicase [Roseomonas sp. HJA6]|uniref:Replicative DNA helicase n=1 Tax=Roseomonas alba TaxID=2846776 RepID=A0ABS7ACG9_9PROT|nr:replicative DNA helicase [Neoroseomonas alba]MBW6400003.1 replicative DNA helicase [Neoroseomonas alba]
MTDPVIGLSLRTPPANLEAEQALLGALLANNKAYERVADIVRAEHFADAVHATIYAAIARRIDTGQLADVVTLRQDFEHSGLLDDAGGPAYLAQLLSAMVGIINADAYARVIRDAWLRRELINTGEVAVNLAFGAEAGVDADAALERVESSLFALGEQAKGRGKGDLADASAIAAQVEAAHFRAVEAKGGLVGLASGYRGFDRLKGGMIGGEFILIGARPAMGKTALAAGITARVAAQQEPVLFVSAEMPSYQVQARMVAAKANLPLQAVLRAFVFDPGSNHGRGLSQRETDAFIEANRAVAALPITWDARARPTVASIRTRARRLKARRGLGLIVVDYLQLLSPGTEGGQGGNRNQELTAISADLKGLAVELDVPVISLSQLSRAVEQREDKRPVMSDLRDSGSLEQDADVIAFLYREEYYLKANPPKRRETEKEEKLAERTDAWRRALADTAGVGELIVAKHRQGATGTVRLRWADRLTWFFDEQEGGGDTPPGGQE